VQRLLVIEDEPGIRNVVSRALSSARLQIDCAADGRSGLEMARSGDHHLVLLDLMRSGLDGVGSAGPTVKVGRRTPRGLFTPTVKATSGSIAYQATTKLREVARS
jgi:DNA-binding NtrC family response regulator